MASTNATKPVKVVNVQPNHLPTSILLTVSYTEGDDVKQASIEMGQTEFLSSYGNINFEGGATKGLRFEGDPVDVLGSLIFMANDTILTVADSGVHTSAPKVWPGATKATGGGNLTVTHSTTIQVATTDGGIATGETVGYVVKVTTTYLGEEKGYSMRASTIKQATHAAAAPKVFGKLSGLTIS